MNDLVVRAALAHIRSPVGAESVDGRRNASGAKPPSAESCSYLIYLKSPVNCLVYRTD
jgi:hypothetical protein